VHAVTGRFQSVVHVPGEGIARLRPVEGDPDDRAATLDDQLVCVIGHESASPNPSSASRAAVSWPSSGPAVSRRTGVREKRIGEPSWRTGPTFACGASQKYRRASRCGSVKTWPKSWIGAHGTPASPS